MWQKAVVPIVVALALFVAACQSTGAGNTAGSDLGSNQTFHRDRNGNNYDKGP